MINNIEQTLTFPASSLIAEDLVPKAYFKKERELAAKAATREDGKLTNEELAELNEALGEKGVAALKSIGAETMFSAVPVTVKLGSAIFDCITVGSPGPEAPLAKAVHAKRMGDLAVRLTAESFELSREEKQVLTNVLSSENDWNKVVISATVSGTAEIRLTKGGASLFNEIIANMVAICEG